jgi:hypothetical protein
MSAGTRQAVVERVAEARPADPKIRMWSSAMVLTASRT